MAEVHEFERRVERGIKGCDLVNEVLREWESIVNRVARVQVVVEQVVSWILALRREPV